MISIVKLKEGKDIYGEVRDWNWKDKFLVIASETNDGDKYKKVIHWDSIEYVMEMEVI